MGKPRTKKGDPPSPRQRELLDCIGTFAARFGFPPSVRELCAAMDVKSPGGIVAQLKALKAKGLIDMPTATARSLLLTTEGWAVRGGNVSADRFWHGSHPAQPTAECVEGLERRHRFNDSREAAVCVGPGFRGWGFFSQSCLAQDAM